MNTSIPVLPHAVALKSYGTDLSNVETKALGTSYATKALGGDPELAAWYEDATAYYNSVMSGETPMPDTASWNQFLQWLQYAQESLYADSSSWGDATSDAWLDPSESPEDPLSDYTDEGPENNHTLTGTQDMPSALTVDGSDPSPYDVWGPLTLEVPPPATATSQIISDTRYSPAEDVIQITVTNPAVRGEDGSPSVSTVYIHDFNAGYTYQVNAEIKPDGSSNFTDDTGGLIASGEYVDPIITQGEIENTVPMANVEAEEMTREETRESYNLFAGTSDSVIEFNEEGMDDGVSTLNDVMGDCSITVKETDKVEVYTNDYSDEYDDMDHSYVLKVIHSDGTTDTFLIHNEYSTNINATEEHITLFNKNDDTGEMMQEHPEVNPDDDKQVIFPEDFSNIANHFTINGLESVRYIDNVDAVEEVEEKAAEEAIHYPSKISNLADEMGLSEEELKKKLQKSKGDGGYGLPSDEEMDKDGNGEVSKDEFNDALEKINFPPILPDQQFFEFLVKYDNHLENLLDAANTSDVSAYMVAMNQVTAHTIDLLKKAYPDVSDIHATESDPIFWWDCNNITFDGQDMEPFPGGENSDVKKAVEQQSEVLYEVGIDIYDWEKDSQDYFNQSVFDLASDKDEISDDPFSSGDI